MYVCIATVIVFLFAMLVPIIKISKSYISISLNDLLQCVFCYCNNYAISLLTFSFSIAAFLSKLSLVL